MQLIKKGDAIIVTIDYGVINVVDGMFASYDVSEEDMRCPNAIMNTKHANNKFAWALTPNDLFLRRIKDDDFDNLPEFGPFVKVMLRALKDGYCWELKCKIVRPRRLR